MANQGLQKLGSNVRSGQHLLKSLTSNPALPAFVPTLPAAGLKSLINEIGLADAGVLVEYTTPEQLATLVDDAVWKRTTPGAPEQFDPDTFLEWIALLLDVGDEFAVERLQAMNEDVVVVAFVHYFRIEDLDNRILDEIGGIKEVYFLPEPVEMSELFGPFEIRPREEEAWETIQPMLAALRAEDPDFLVSILTRCCLPESLLMARGDDTAFRDAEGDHQERRLREGFVTVQSAHAFLTSACDESLEALIQATAYDLDTQAYFQRALKVALETVISPAGGSRQLTHGEGLPADTPEAAFTDVEAMAELTQIVTDVELAGLEAPVALLGRPGREDEPPGALTAALSELSEDNPGALAERMNEMGYLSNLLMTGTRLGDEFLSQREAAAAVIATCSLGYEYWPEADLSQEPGLVGIFRVGWHLLQRIPRETVARLVDVTQSADLESRFGVRAWMVADVLKAVASPEMLADIELQRYGAVHDVLRMLSLVLEDHALERLLHLVDYLPAMQKSDGVKVRQRVHFIESRADLAEVGAFLGELPQYFRQ